MAFWIRRHSAPQTYAFLSLLFPYCPPLLCAYASPSGIGFLWHDHKAGSASFSYWLLLDAHLLCGYAKKT